MSAELRELLRDLTRPIPGIAIKRMFGGLGLFADGQMFGLVAGDDLYFKADAETAAAFDAEDLPPFSYTKKDGIAVLTSYRRAPERLLDDADEFLEWARAAIAAARRFAARPKPRRKGRKPEGIS